MCLTRSCQVYWCRKYNTCTVYNPWKARVATNSKNLLRHSSSSNSISSGSGSSRSIISSSKSIISSSSSSIIISVTSSRRGDNSRVISSVYSRHCERKVVVINRYYRKEWVVTVAEQCFVVL